MSAWSAELELELACKVGSENDLKRALEEGADVNWDGGAPLFLAIMGGHRALIEQLLEAGADPSPFLDQGRLRSLNGKADIVALLCEVCPPPVDGDHEESLPSGADEFDDLDDLDDAEEADTGGMEPESSPA